MEDAPVSYYLAALPVSGMRQVSSLVAVPAIQGIVGTLPGPVPGIVLPESAAISAANATSSFIRPVLMPFTIPGNTAPYRLTRPWRCRHLPGSPSRHG